ncbi:MAG: AAA domain-containing protein [candidate division Zixibacteria bacterium]|nr:AAA domain-containing protein [candidate division Zixibacteria bacterium]
MSGAFDESARSRLTKLARFCGLAVQRCGELGRRTMPSVLPESKDVRTEGLFEFRSDVMRAVMRYLERAIQTDAPILLLGENGVGKDYLARWVHDASPRRDAPFVEVNLPELAPQMLESELFGIEANAATGVDGSDGLIRYADGGTVFLNEIAELSLQSQATLLRTIESRSIRRVKGREAFPVNVRFISATNQDLQKLINAEKFRRDLYYRINLNEVSIPPLRERPEDVEPLANFIIHQKCARLGRPVMRLPKTVAKQMEQMPWMGNVRELSNLVERVVLSHAGDEFPRLQADGTFEPTASRGRKRMHGRSLKDQVQEFERDIIESTLRDVGGVQLRAARLLRMSEASLRDKMKRLGIQRPKQMR